MAHDEDARRRHRRGPGRLFGSGRPEDAPDSGNDGLAGFAAGLRAGLRASFGVGSSVSKSDRRNEARNERTEHTGHKEHKEHNLVGRSRAADDHPPRSRGLHGDLRDHSSQHDGSSFDSADADQDSDLETPPIDPLDPNEEFAPPGGVPASHHYRARRHRNQENPPAQSVDYSPSADHSALEATAGLSNSGSGSGSGPRSGPDQPPKIEPFAGHGAPAVASHADSALPDSTSSSSHHDDALSETGGAADAEVLVPSVSEPSRLARCFARARPMLHSMVALLEDDESLVVAADDRGFPVAQRRILRPSDLPRALVIGRHNRCALPIGGDDHVSLRHLLLTIWPSAGPLRIKGVDLGGRGGVLLADRKRVAGFSAQTHLAITIGRTHLFVLPGGTAGRKLLDCEEQLAFRRLTGVDATGHLSGSNRPHATAEPGAAELGGYRAMEPISPPAPRGILRLRSTRDGRELESRDLEINEEEIQRGLLIGRYSDRCSLAGDGRNLSRVHALVSEESPQSLLVYDLASTNGVRPMGQTRGPSFPVVRMTPSRGCMLGHFELSWQPMNEPLIH